MRIMVVVGHPQRDSFCHSLAGRASSGLRTAGHGVTVHDLYLEGFQPVGGADRLVNEHREELATADGLVVVHPNWWGKPPAIVAGWLDRVVVPGVAYDLLDPVGEPIGLLNLDGALILNTGDTPIHREAEIFGDPLDVMWRRCVLAFCGVARESVHRRLFSPVAGSTEQSRTAWLDETAELCSTVFPG